MSKIRYCEECNEPIRWDEKIVQIENGDLYHEDCCFSFPIRYGVMVDGVYKGSSDYGTQIAFILLNSEEYIDIEERESE